MKPDSKQMFSSGLALRVFGGFGVFWVFFLEMLNAVTSLLLCYAGAGRVVVQERAPKLPPSINFSCESGITCVSETRMQKECLKKNL